MSKFKVISQRLDAQESIFFARELEHILTATIDVEYPELKARTLIPINTESPSGTTSITYRQFDKVGLAKIVANYAEDLPRVDILGQESTSKVHVIADSFGYSVLDLKRAQLVGISLDQKKAMTAREAALRCENKAAFLGDTRYGMTGMLACTNGVHCTLLSDGTGASKLFSEKTADQLVRDIEALLNAPGEATYDIESPDTVLLSPRCYNILKGKKIGVDSGMTVLKFLKENNPSVNFVKVNELTNYANSVDRIIAYRRDPSKVEMHVVSDFTMLNPQDSGLELVVPCFQEFGGVTVYKPLSFAYEDGVGADA
jgi:hypothetical protein